MNSSRVVFFGLLALIPSLSGCRDLMSPEPLGAQTAELAEIQALLNQVITKLDSLDDRVAALSVEAGAGVSAGVSAVLEASLCGKYGIEADARMRSSVTLRGTGIGTLGVDGYGNGAKGQVQAFGGQMVSVIPQGGVSGEFQICAKLEGHGGVDAGVGATIDVSDPVLALLNDLTSSVGTGGLTTMASTRGMSGGNASTALNALTNFNVSDLAFGGGGAASLVNSLPLPTGLADLVNNPSGILGKASDAATYAVDQICGTTLRVGEFADLVQAGCDLRSTVPPPSDVISIFSGLNGLAPAVQSLQTAMSSVCSKVGSVTNASINIPPRTVTILGTTYTTFPGYSAALFPSISAPSC